MRNPIPKNATYYGWQQFNMLADREGVGEDPDDFMPWWVFWMTGFLAAKNE